MVEALVQEAVVAADGYEFCDKQADPSGVNIFSGLLPTVALASY